MKFCFFVCWQANIVNEPHGPIWLSLVGKKKHKSLPGKTFFFFLNNTKFKEVFIMWSLIWEISGYIMDNVFNYHFSSNREVLFKWQFLILTLYKSWEHNIKSYIHESLSERNKANITQVCYSGWPDLMQRHSLENLEKWIVNIFLASITTAP